MMTMVEKQTIIHIQNYAEFMAMAYRCAPNTIVIGSTTTGADGSVFQFVLPGGIWTGFSGIGIYYPDGRKPQHVGIIPDVEVKPTVKGIRIEPQVKLRTC